jgi:hypothetical protein
MTLLTLCSGKLLSELLYFLSAMTLLPPAYLKKYSTTKYSVFPLQMRKLAIMLLNLKSILTLDLPQD